MIRCVMPGLFGIDLPDVLPTSSYFTPDQVKEILARFNSTGNYVEPQHAQSFIQGMEEIYLIRHELTQPEFMERWSYYVFTIRCDVAINLRI